MNEPASGPCHPHRRSPIRFTLAAALAASLIIALPVNAARETPRSYGHRLTLARWHSQAEWRSLDEIVRPESGWDPCSSYPGRHDCRYAGANSCGIPQANPCPQAWRGRLAETWRAQVRWVVDYVQRRYGRPSAALGFRQRHGYY